MVDAPHPPNTTTNAKMCHYTGALNCTIFIACKNIKAFKIYTPSSNVGPARTTPETALWNAHQVIPPIVQNSNAWREQGRFLTSDTCTFILQTRILRHMEQV